MKFGRAHNLRCDTCLLPASSSPGSSTGEGFNTKREDTTMASAHHIGWIGLGRMGEPMAAYLIKAGQQVSIWNRTKAKAEPLVKLGGTIVDTPAALAGCDVVFLMVSTGKDVEQVVFGI